ncbi:hypothetical protein C4J81_06350 [Deltaproteobacteria bacterium Smac51]|nr:hypothetical protein C4J81_06350 [Deltaproteobacteria bacterium Smac51]
MRIACYSDLHLEFKHHWTLPLDLEADILVLAGDIIVFNDFSPLKILLENWPKPVIFVPGNHEYYNLPLPMPEYQDLVKNWLARELPQVHYLHNQAVKIGGVNFFGGTMWTDFNEADEFYMQYAASRMSDFNLIYAEQLHLPRLLKPIDTVKFHSEFMDALMVWFKKRLRGPRVVISHHVPVANPDSKHLGTPLQPAFVATDVHPLIEKYQPDIWVCGHTHESHRHDMGKTKIISNQLGYPMRPGGYESGTQFDAYGLRVEI